MNWQLLKYGDNHLIDIIKMILMGEMSSHIRLHINIHKCGYNNDFYYGCENNYVYKQYQSLNKLK